MICFVFATARALRALSRPVSAATHPAPALTIPPGDFDAYIFDCDGTLADTMPTHYRAWQTALGAHAENFPEAMFYELGGVPTARIVEIINERHGLAIPVESTVAHKESVFLELSPEIAAIEPVVAIAKRLRGVKPMAVASGGHRRIVTNKITRFWHNFSRCLDS